MNVLRVDQQIYIKDKKEGDVGKKITVNFYDPDIGIDITKEIFKREEWVVPCNWCGAKVG